MPAYKRESQPEEEWTPERIHKIRTLWNSKSLVWVANNFKPTFRKQGRTLSAVDCNIAEGTLTRKVARILAQDAEARADAGEDYKEPKVRYQVAREADGEDKEADEKGMVYVTTMQKCGGKGQMIRVRELVHKDSL